MKAELERRPKVNFPSHVFAMREELSRALFEALFELDVLPRDEDGALVGLYAVMDDLDEAIRRVQALDLAHTA